MKHLTIQDCMQRGNVGWDPNDRNQVVLYQCINVQPESNPFNCKTINFQRTLFPLADCPTPFFVMQRNGSVVPEIGMLSRLLSPCSVQTATCLRRNPSRFPPFSSLIWSVSLSSIPPLSALPADYYGGCQYAHPVALAGFLRANHSMKASVLSTWRKPSDSS